MKIPSLLEMLQAGMHFGHQVSRWHPKMKPYIYTDRNGVHIIDLEKTQEKLEETLAAVKKMAAEGKVIMFVTTKPQAKEIVKQAAIDCDMPYLVERWLGGMLTNYSEMKKLIRRYIDWKDKQATGEFERYSKKERLEIQKQLDKMDTTLVGLTKLERMPDALFIPALQREKTAMLEAQRMNVPIIAVCDTNSNPDLAEHFIPANDDAVNSIRMISGLISAAIKEGREEFKRKNTENVSRQSK
ncbi:MAG TPA: 30S ribosomal protein S2 [Candidatus Magasanikbacteria bacterium]|nr:30S ribosomal protein S2 [Candidatus Magasanikbacteria bacterium]